VALRHFKEMLKSAGFDPKKFGLHSPRIGATAMRHSAESNLIIEYLREYEFIFKTALAHESGDPEVLFAEKNRGSKIS
jgi:hypothetical protein